MKRFVLKTVLFAALAVVIYGGWAGALLWAEIASYRREARLPPDVTTVVCGDSQTETGLLPHVWPHFFNFSISSLQLDQVELKVIDLLERNPGFRGTVILDMSPVKLFDQDVDRPLLEDRSAGKRFLLHALHPDRSRRPLNGLAILFRDSILVKRTTKALKFFRAGGHYVSSIGGMGSVADLTEERAEAFRARFRSMPTVQGFVTHPDLVREGMEEAVAELDRWGSVTADAKSVRCLREILRFVRARGAKPVLMTTPWHAALRSRLRPGFLENFRNVMRQVAAEERVVHLDYLEMPFPDEEWRDANHLNIRGAVRLTDRVRQDLAQTFGEGGET